MKALVAIAVTLAIVAKVALMKIKPNHLLVAAVLLCMFMSNTTERRVGAVRTKGTRPQCKMIENECRRCLSTNTFVGRDGVRRIDQGCVAIAGACAACELS